MEMCSINKLVNRISIIEDNIGSIGYKYTIVILSNLYSYSYNVHTYNGIVIYMYIIYISYIHYIINIKIVSMSIYQNIGTYINYIYNILLLIQSKEVWGKWIIDVTDVKNTKYHHISKSYYPVCIPQWEIKKYYDGRSSIEYHQNYHTTYYNSVNIIVLLDKELFMTIRSNNSYMSHIYRYDVRFYDRKYYSIKDRYISTIVKLLHSYEEFSPISLGTYVASTLPNVYCTYADKWLSKIKYKLHSWDKSRLDWLEIKRHMLAYTIRWHGYRSVYNGVLYGHDGMNNRIDYKVGKLGHYAYDLLDIDIYSAYTTLMYANYKLLNSNNHNVAKIDLGGLYIKDVKEVVLEGTRIIYAILSVKIKVAVDIIDSEGGDGDVTMYSNDISIHSHITVDKYNSWVYMTDEWLADYEWLSLHLAPYHIICEIILLNHFTIEPGLNKNIGYWYDVITNGLRHKPSLVRLVSHEYGKFHNFLLVDNFNNDIVGYSKTYNSDIELSIVSLYNTEYDTISIDAEMYQYSINNRLFSRIYNVMSSIDWWVNKGYYNTMYNTLCNTDTFSHVYPCRDSINSYGAVETNVLTIDSNIMLVNILDIVVTNMNVRFQETYLMVYNTNHSINSYYDSLDISVSDVVSLTSVNFSRLWRAKLERIYLIEYENRIYQLNIYKYNKAVLLNKDSFVNFSILKQLKAAKMIDNDYVGHWEDIPNDIVNPYWYSVLEMNIKAKIQVLRYCMRWSNDVIMTFFVDQEKWEAFIRISDPDEEVNRIYKLNKFANHIVYANIFSYQFKLKEYIRVKLIKDNGNLPVIFRMLLYNRIFIYGPKVNKPVSVYSGDLLGTIAISLSPQKMEYSCLGLYETVPIIYINSIVSFIATLYNKRDYDSTEVVMIFFTSDKVDYTKYVYYLVHVDKSYSGSVKKADFIGVKSLVITPSYLIWQRGVLKH